MLKISPVNFSMNDLLFAPAGVPLSCEKRSTIAGIKCTKELGLDAMEMEFVRGVRLKISAAREVGELAKKEGILLTAHAPYYINLLSKEENKIEASKKRIIDTALVVNAAKGYSVVFHAAYYGSYSKEEAFKLVKERLSEAIEELKARNARVWVRPELTGKRSQWGSLDELIKISQELDMVLPCIDFAHMHAREGKMNSKEEWRSVLSKVEEELGREALENMHIHISGIAYSEKGERYHLNLEESDLKWRGLLEVLKEFNVKGVAVSESPNIEQDALLMKKFWKSLVR